MNGEYSIIPTIVKRDGISYKEAQKLVKEARERVLMDGEDPHEILLNEFGLEPDYLFDLMF